MNTILILEYKGAWEPFGGGAYPGSADEYASMDQSEQYRIAVTAASEPALYSKLTPTELQTYSELEPECSY